MASEGGGDPGLQVESDEGDAAIPTGQYCPRCGDAAGDGTDTCPGCGLDVLSASTLLDLVTTAEKDRERGTGIVGRIPILAPLVLWRQVRIEGAQRDLLDHKMALHEGSALHCRACGGALESDDATCGECGELTDLGIVDGLEYDVHDPTEYDSSVSDRWWLAVVGGPVLGFLGTVLTGLLEVSASPVFLVAGSVVAVVGWYFDGKYLRANTLWNPPYWFYVPVLLVPVINLIGAGYYLKKRVALLGRGEHV